MTQVTIHQAKTNLSRLIKKAMQGEEIIIAKRDQPMVRLEVIKSSPTKRTFGWMKGKIWMAPDFDDLLPEMEQYTFTDAELAQRGKATKRRK